ncbi:hypothetical protein Nepgr_005571 [Nepenthes gracilis]|uniref:Letm1 RBD domain-containing protein n=1 Tax=Nepenthes gracilis TaxID=150966 RepID=A0AAD3XGK2_NEPGR|nr:hypothetical protein Nepgr_005571 [Nepenthes gracilis]
MTSTTALCHPALAATRHRHVVTIRLITSATAGQRSSTNLDSNQLILCGFDLMVFDFCRIRGSKMSWDNIREILWVTFLQGNLAVSLYFVSFSDPSYFNSRSSNNLMPKVVILLSHDLAVCIAECESYFYPFVDKLLCSKICHWLFLIEGDYIQLRDGAQGIIAATATILLKAIKEVDVVISTVGHALLADETKIIAAIKEAGANIKEWSSWPVREWRLEDCIAIHVLLEGTFLDHDAESSEFFNGFCLVFLEVDCETMEGLDLHSQTREHQKKAMDMVLRIKQQNSKKTSNDRSSIEDGNKSRNASFEGHENKHDMDCSAFDVPSFCWLVYVSSAISGAAIVVETAVEGLSTVKAKARAKQLQESQKSDKPILQRVWAMLLGIAPALKAVASMSREDWAKKLLHWKDEIKSTLQHYWLGTKLLWSDIRISSRLLLKLAGGKSLSRRERQQLTRTTADIFRLVPFAVFIIVPFMEFLLPVFLKLFPNMLPSTFQDKMKEQVMVLVAVARFLEKYYRASSYLQPNDLIDEDMRSTIGLHQSASDERMSSK